MKETLSSETNYSLNFHLFNIILTTVQRGQEYL